MSERKCGKCGAVCEKTEADLIAEAKAAAWDEMMDDARGGEPDGNYGRHRLRIELKERGVEE